MSCYNRHWDTIDDAADDLGGDAARVESDDREPGPDDWLPIGDVVSGLLRGWRGDDE